MAEEKKEKDKATALVVIGQRPDTFKWNLQGTVFDKSGLLKEVSAETKTGELIVMLVQKIAPDSPKEGSYQLGKRPMCLLCGIEVLITKAGNGALVCCGQNMEINSPRPIPSSD